MNKLQRIIAAGVIGLPLLLGVYGCKKAENDTVVNMPIPSASVSAEVEQDNRLRNTILTYLSQPRFSNADFLEQITGTKTEFQMLDQQEGMVYLSVPKEHYTKKVLKELVLNPDSVEFGKSESGEFSGDRIKLGDYVLKMPGNYFFRFPSKNFRVDESDIINIPYRSGNYSINMNELQDFVSNESIFGGYLKIDTGINKYGGHNIISNHGALVAEKGESSLERLVNLIAGKKKTKEAKAQKLLDFVIEELEYNYSEANLNVEVLKRPNEVLMTGGSDCSGKVILYASLLEQIDINYRLVYLDGHIAVAVEGDFSNSNGLSFGVNGTIYSMAETTARGFLIGRSSLKNAYTVKDIQYVQRPGRESKVYDVRTGKALPFR